MSENTSNCNCFNDTVYECKVRRPMNHALCDSDTINPMSGCVPLYA